MADALAALRRALAARFADPPRIAAAPPGVETLARMAGRGSRRAFAGRPVAGDLIELLCAVALAAPSKSDLQQRDIVLVGDAAVRRAIDRLVGEQDWIARAPALLVFCADNRRQRLVHEWRGRPFANDHLDAFFNAAVDAAIVDAAEAAGLGCCPISAVRNRAQAVSDALGLPDHVFPLAGLAVGWPAGPATISRRLPLALTVHRDRFDPDPGRAAIEAYDRDRAAAQPYASQRNETEFGAADDYGWMEDKARQYARPERADFGAFVRAKGFRLD